MLTKATTADMKIGTLKVTNIFNIAILVITVAHKIIGYISLPLVLLYLAGVCTIRNFEAITIAIMLLWVGIPGLISFAFWWKKYHILR